MHSHFGQQRPPYVEFEQRAVEDRQKTIETGGYTARDVDFAIIRAIGAKDAVEKPAVEWLAHLKQLEQLGDWPREWVKFFHEQYAEWKAGHEITPNGTHVKNWGSVSPAEVATLIAAKILTVEDVAGATEEALQRIGMGARSLKQRAQAWMDSRANGKSAEELALLREDNKNQKDIIEQQDSTIKELQRQIDKLATRMEKLSGAEDGDEEAAPRPTRRRA
jgi:hypothetical protein